jgi:hypothetical protein
MVLVLLTLCWSCYSRLPGHRDAVKLPHRAFGSLHFTRNWNSLNKVTYLIWNLTFHYFSKFGYRPISNLWGGGWEMILYISRICFYSVTYVTLFVSLLYSKNVAHKYFRHLANNSVQIYFA